MRLSSVKKFWLGQKMTRWPLHLLEELKIHEPSKRFMNEVGLPARCEWFDSTRGGVRSLRRIESNPNFRLVGFSVVPLVRSVTTPICLDEQREGRVVHLRDGATSFINSNVESFGESLIWYKKLCFTHPRNVAGQISHLSTFEQRLRKIDPAAFSRHANFWPSMVEEIRDSIYW